MAKPFKVTDPLEFECPSDNGTGERQQKDDDIELSRLGKKPVLRVSADHVNATQQ